MKHKKTALTAVILSGSLSLGVQSVWTQDPGSRPPGQTIPDKIEPKGVEPKAGQPASMAKDDIKKIEEALKARGHDPGPVDGIMDSKTQSALRAFQKANNLAETGVVDSQTAAKLGVQAGGSTSRSPAESTPGSKGTSPGSKEEGTGLKGSGPGSSSPKGGETGSGSEGKSPVR